MDYNVNWALRHFYDFKDGGSGSDGVEVVEIRPVNFWVALRNKAYDGFIGLKSSKQAFASLSSYCQRGYCPRIGNSISNWQDGDCIRQFEFAVVLT
ncbi:hypothetical protein ES703_37861 [subsurface metagenome]